MTNDKLVLNISKINISPDSTRLKYSQDERGKQVDITVIDNDGVTAYNLTGKKLFFQKLKMVGKLSLMMNQPISLDQLTTIKSGSSLIFFQIKLISNQEKRDLNSQRI